MLKNGALVHIESCVGVNQSEVSRSCITVEHDTDVEHNKGKGDLVLVFFDSVTYQTSFGWVKLKS